LTVARRRTLRERIGDRIARKRDDVFLTREFRDLGGEDQVLRALRGMVREGQLVRLGYGVYGVTCRFVQNCTLSRLGQERGGNIT
jgi:hypothetical protein